MGQKIIGLTSELTLSSSEILVPILLAPYLMRLDSLFVRINSDIDINREINFTRVFRNNTGSQSEFVKRIILNDTDVEFQMIFSNQLGKELLIKEGEMLMLLYNSGAAVGTSKVVVGASAFIVEHSSANWNPNIKYR